MRIASQTVFNNLVSQIQTLGSTQSTLQDELSTGLSFTNPSDNPSAMESTLNLISESRQVAQFGTNAATALQLSQASYSGLSQLKSLTDKISELATEANNGTDSATQLQDYATEVNQYIEQAVQLGNSQFEGNYLYAGTAVTQPPFTVTRDSTGQITAVAYAGNSDSAEIPISTTSSVAATTSGTVNQGLASLMNQFVALRTALQNSDTASVQTAQTGISTSEDTLISAAAESAAVQSGIEAEQSQQTTLGQNLDTIISGNTSADVATTDVKLTQAETAYQAVLESSARIMQTTLLNYLSTSS
jgi:flagellar hook-associated protein 3 FlgL